MFFALPTTIGAVVIVIAFLGVSGDSTATGSAREETACDIEMLFELCVMTTVKHVLGAIKESLRNKRCVIARIKAVLAEHETHIEFVVEEMVERMTHDFLSRIGTKPLGIKKI